MISRETRRLRRMFERILVLSAAGGAGIGAYACSSGSGTTGASGDASTPSDASSSAHPDGPSEASSNDAVLGDVGAGDAGCNPNAAPDAPWSQCCEPEPPVPIDAGADVAANCVFHVTLPCGLPSFVTQVFPPTCVLNYSDCLRICTGPSYPSKCEVANGYGCDDDAMAFVAADGQAITIECDKCGAVGRRPAGLTRPRALCARTTLGRHFASAAYLEAASVHAFERLASELETHGAGRDLVDGARRSARDEIRHARVTTRLARRFGGNPPAVRVKPKRSRTLSAVALENAVEGCVRETFGALVATWQARNARDPEIRLAMKRIAVDETRHAALSWAVARALEPRLDARAMRRVAAARVRAIAVLRREATASAPTEVAQSAGLPGPIETSRMLDELSATLWT